MKRSQGAHPRRPTGFCASKSAKVIDGMRQI
jgi:hypothetical protein